MIVCRTHIGYGLPTRQDTAKAHGEPPGDEELNGAKDKLGWPLEPRFYIPEDVLAHFRQAVDAGAEQVEAEWKDRLSSYTSRLSRIRLPNCERRLKGELARRLGEQLCRYSRQIRKGWRRGPPRGK